MCPIIKIPDLIFCSKDTQLQQRWMLAGFLIRRFISSFPSVESIEIPLVFPLGVLPHSDFIQFRLILDYYLV